ncbi:MAG: prolipoprotein diacylglyceryl transferase [Bdellovibrionales bacterium]
MLTFPQIDPVAFSLGPIEVRWYALAYMLGFIGGWWLAGRMADRTPAHLQRAGTRADFDDFLTWAIVGTILGGRIGYILFYNLGYYLSHPLEILQVWHGGMSFHGGALGVCVAFFLFCKARNIDWRAFGDVIACVVPLGLGLGRIANFINGELYGRVSDGAWAMVFPDGGVNPRHPSQLYQAALEGFLLLFIMLALSRVYALRGRPGMLGGIFLFLYAVFRSIGEEYRSPDVQLGFIIGDVTMGQILCIPMAIIGIALIKQAAGMHLPPRPVTAPAADVPAAENPDNENR